MESVDATDTERAGRQQVLRMYAPQMYLLVFYRLICTSLETPLRSVEVLERRTTRALRNMT